MTFAALNMGLQTYIVVNMSSTREDTMYHACLPGKRCSAWVEVC